MTQKNTQKNQIFQKSHLRQNPEITPKKKQKPDIKKNEKNISPYQRLPIFHSQNLKQDHLHI